MIRLFISSCLLFLTVFALGQNYYNFENSKKFGDYLFNTGQFQLASEEFERAFFLNQSDASTALMLMKSYRKNGQLHNAINSYYRFAGKPDFKTMPGLFSDEYLKVLIEQNSFDQGLKLVRENCCLKYKSRYELGLLMLTNNRDAFSSYVIDHQPGKINDHLYTQLTDLARASVEKKHRKPWVGSVLSAILPGAGKVYAGYWRDGIIGFLFCASTGYVAYKSFDKYGKQSAYSWVMGGIALSYYAGNVYGGQKSVKLYNYNLDQKLKNDTESILHTDF